MFGVSKPLHLLDGRNANLADRRIVEHDVDDVGRRAVFLPELGELAVEVAVLGGPLLAVLRLEDVVLGIMDDLGLVSLCEGSLVDDQQAGDQHRGTRIL